MNEEVKMVQDALEGLQSKLDKALNDHTAEIEKHGKATTDLTGKVDELSGKWAEQSKKMADLIEKTSAAYAPGTQAAETLGLSVTKSAEYDAIRNGKLTSAKIEVKNTITGSAGSPADPVDTIVAPDRRPGIVPGAFRALTILDVIPMSSTGSNIYQYTQEEDFVNRAAETAEGSAKPESDTDFMLIEEPVRTIAHWKKVSNQVIADAPALETYLNTRLVHGLRNKLEQQILTGSGSSPALAGLSSSGRHTAFTPATGDTSLDSINRAKYLVTGNDFAGTHVFINPQDWGVIERSKTDGGGYVLGDGAAVNYVAGGMIPTVWGLIVIPSNNVPLGKMFTLDINAINLVMRQGATVEMGFVDKDFTNNLMTIRAELRAALAVWQPAAVRYGDLTL